MNYKSIGSDIEFGIFDNEGNIVSATSFLLGDAAGKQINLSRVRKYVIYDDNDSDISVRSPIGADGCPIIGELRPPAETTCSRHAEEVVKLTTAIRKCVEENEFVFFPFVFNPPQHSCGGHIHIGHNDSVIQVALVKFLDIIVKRTVESIFPRDLVLRRMLDTHGCYGSPENYDTKSYGTEYRGLPSFIHSDGLIRAVFSLIDAALRIYNDNIQRFMGFIPVELMYTTAGDRIYERVFREITNVVPQSGVSGLTSAMADVLAHKKDVMWPLETVTVR